MYVLVENHENLVSNAVNMKLNNLQAVASDLQYWADSYISHPHRTDDSLDV